MHEVPLLMLMLLMREKVWIDTNKSGFSLLEQEKLDKLSKVPWEELVKQNRLQLSKQIR